MDKKEPIEKVIKLVAKTGLFFAHADGKYDAREKRYIQYFIDKLSEIGPVDEVLEKEITGSLNKEYSLQEIVDETKDLLKNFNEPEQDVIKLTLKQFVTNVINSDCVENNAEKENFNAWQKALAE
ncbi:MAG: hypothetical protein IJ628_03015 [Bacteroidaceae bacterium]|jgi:ABC-type oligopeptide transport system ATPase subunit|nr:hypothetical protein [Bacteroidaceae bacterium]